MQIIGYNRDSLNRHGVTPEMMLVGYTFTERLLEIGIRYKSATEVYIFHAQTVSPQYRKLFEEDWKNG
ncbi:MAG: hypothetical protein JST01_23755 [Cyanobacteria bacterium SZAS TMP-1]|nr:hypothetical protein [Cyanobacteria bacterium SZAS TMP-1]